MFLSQIVLCAFFGTGLSEKTFPKWFKFGVATSSYQIEGAWNVSEKSESIWDRFTHHNPEAIKNDDNGDVACDSYNLWKEDIKMAVDLGLDYYRFSISWPRLLPTSFSNRISEDGKNYYNNLIDGLLENGIEPMVTIYHWDLPQRLQDMGGWTNPLISDWFADYARAVFSLYADRVKIWLTLNEPLAICDISYNYGILAPGIKDPDIANYICIKNLILAHSKAWRIYDEEFRPKYHGKISLTNALLWIEPKNPEDQRLADLSNDLGTGMYTHAIFSKTGGWPPAIEKAIEEFSLREGHKRSKLPSFTKEEIKFVKGTFDFFAFNFYTSRLVRPRKEDDEQLHWPLQGVPLFNGIWEVKPEWEVASQLMIMYPEGLRHQLLALKKQYGDIEFMITENGYPTTYRDLDDEKRVKCIRDHLEQVLLSIHEDKVNVTRYTVWSLMDNFEWMDGYETRFGLYDVDFSSPTRARTPRASAHYYKKVIKTHKLMKSSKLINDEFIWDQFTHEYPEAIADKSNGDRACDSYHYWKRDVEVLKELNVHFYRFSIPWPRVLPTGYDNVISEDGKNYYNNLINALLKEGIEPIVTLYHWDLPLNIEKLGGWTNPMIVHWFTDYARVIFALYSDRVKNWITFNEPLVFCDFAYITGSLAPGIQEPIYGHYLCNIHVMLAHASAYRLYHKHFSHTKGCKVSIANHLIYLYPQSEKEKAVTELLSQYINGRYLHPIYSKGGDWPSCVKKLVKDSSKRRGFHCSRLPRFTKAEIFPEGLRGILNWLKKNYGNLEYFITENGYSSGGYNLKDKPRIKYIKDHLKQIWLAIKEDKINMSGYTHWSLLDNFEWGEGYKAKFGLYETDFRDPSLKRSPRESAQFYADTITKRMISIHSKE
ncbi:hypothetical protein K1T71_012879 [Dendrolimus kikuchii]|uniref:Uncharacterized protein n=1 Tax=Dendrolimus kikuchii TaxID=765133 RepID=A0ACC1CIC0_9NEOP|nr:hypothetical protein K1T71_012879 [Dendrolimus kikuchii]